MEDCNLFVKAIKGVKTSYTEKAIQTYSKLTETIYNQAELESEGKRSRECHKLGAAEWDWVPGGILLMSYSASYRL